MRKRLAIGTTVLLRMGKARYAWTTVIPMCFLALTTVVAGYLNITTNYLPKGNYLLAGASAVMMVLVVFVIADAVRVWQRIRAEQSGKAKLQRAV